MGSSREGSRPERRITRERLRMKSLRATSEAAMPTTRKNASAQAFKGLESRPTMLR